MAFSIISKHVTSQELVIIILLSYPNPAFVYKRWIFVNCVYVCSRTCRVFSMFVNFIFIHILNFVKSTFVYCLFLNMILQRIIANLLPTFYMMCICPSHNDTGVIKAVLHTAQSTYDNIIIPHLLRCGPQFPSASICYYILGHIQLNII